MEGKRQRGREELRERQRERERERQWMGGGVPLSLACYGRQKSINSLIVPTVLHQEGCVSGGILRSTVCGGESNSALVGAVLEEALLIYQMLSKGWPLSAPPAAGPITQRDLSAAEKTLPLF